MSRDPLTDEPQRWLDRASDDPGQALLRQANREYPIGLNPTRAWYALQQRRKRRASAQALTLVIALVGASAISVWFARPRPLFDPSPALVLLPEPPRPAAVRTSSAAVVPEARTAQREGERRDAREPRDADEPQRGATLGLRRVNGSPRAEPSALRAAESSRTQDGVRQGGSHQTPSAGAPGLAARSPSHPSERAVAAGADELRCRELALQSPSQAATCYEQLSRGDRLQAEVALLELARLRAERLGDARGALGTLEEHRRRFPHGALRGEVDLAIVRALVRLGQTSEALSQSATLLAKPWGRAVASELHFTRGRLYEERLGDCARAVSEYVALLGERGAAAEEAELRRARCLAQLGRREDARQALERYLKRGYALFRDQARQQLAQLDATGRPTPRP